MITVGSLPKELFLPFKNSCASGSRSLDALSRRHGDVNAVCCVKGVMADSMRSWLTKASDHVEEISVYLQSEMHLTQCQIDEIWSFILKKSQLERRRTLS